MVSLTDRAIPGGGYGAEEPSRMPVYAKAYGKWKAGEGNATFVLRAVFCFSLTQLAATREDGIRVEVIPRLANLNSIC